MNLQELLINTLKKIGIIFLCLVICVIIFYTLFYNNAEFKEQLSSIIDDSIMYENDLTKESEEIINE